MSTVYVRVRGMRKFNGLGKGLRRVVPENMKENPRKSNTLEQFVPDRTIVSTCAIRLLMFVFLAAYASFLTACGAKMNTSKNLDMAALMDEAEKKAYLVNQFRAEFVKTRRSSVFNHDMTVKGVLLFQKPDKFQLSISGDVNIQVLSNGRIVTVTHDHKDTELYHVHGERDLSKMADPLMQLIESLGNGGMRRFAIINTVQEGNTLIAEIDPSNSPGFARIKNATLAIDDSGNIKKVKINFKNGDVDETEFKSWTLLAQNDPEIVSLNDRLGKLAGDGDHTEERGEVPPKDVAPSGLAEASATGKLSIE